MPYQIPPEALAIATKLGAEHRIVHRGQTMKKINGEMEPDLDKPGAITCVIIDKLLKVEYCQAEGGDEPEAIINAYRAAVTAPKPMTPAQKFSAGQVSTANAAADAARTELDATKLKLAEMEAQLAAAVANAKPVTEIKSEIPDQAKIDPKPKPPKA